MRAVRRGVVFLVLAAVAAGPAVAVAAGNAAAGRDKATACSTCHGIDGNGRVPLAGKDEAYLLAQMKAFKRGERQNPTMKSIMAELTAQDLADLAAYFSAQKRR